METIETKLKPDLQSGIEFIDMFNFGVRNYKLVGEHTINTLFKNIFKPEQVDHLSKKFTYEKLAGFFLNLDTSNQIRFLIAIGFDKKLFALPSIENWKEHGKELGMEDWEGGFTEEDVRTCGIMFMSEWDLIPHALKWISNYLLFINNHQIEDVAYAGEKFGNYPNWSKYLKHLSLQEKQNFAKLLIHYR